MPNEKRQQQLYLVLLTCNGMPLLCRYKSEFLLLIALAATQVYRCASSLPTPFLVLSFGIEHRKPRCQPVGKSVSHRSESVSNLIIIMGTIDFCLTAGKTRQHKVIRLSLPLPSIHHTVEYNLELTKFTYTRLLANIYICIGSGA